MKKIMTGFLLMGVFCNSFAGGKPAPSHAVSVQVVNRCNSSIIFHVDNNWGSKYTGDYTLGPNGSKNSQGDRADATSFIFMSNNDEEYYTVSYHNATCKVDYPLIRDKWMLEASFSNCATTPKCELH